MALEGTRIIIYFEWAVVVSCTTSSTNCDRRRCQRSRFAKVSLASSSRSKITWSSRHDRRIEPVETRRYACLHCNCNRNQCVQGQTGVRSPFDNSIKMKFGTFPDGRPNPSSSEFDIFQMHAARTEYPRHFCHVTFL
jgi:hypothetical protein